MSKTKIFKNKVLVFGLLLAFLIAGCAGAETTEPAPTSPATETVVEVSPTPADTATVSHTDTAVPTREPTVTSPPPATATGEPAAETPQVDQQLTKNELVAAVKSDLASRLEISEEQIVVVSAEAVTWSDTSLGCPEKGKMYVQVLTPGFQVILELDGAQYDYHADEYGQFVLCE